MDRYDNGGQPCPKPRLSRPGTGPSSTRNELHAQRDLHALRTGNLTTTGGPLSACATARALLLCTTAGDDHMRCLGAIASSRSASMDNAMPPLSNGMYTSQPASERVLCNCQNPHFETRHAPLLCSEHGASSFCRLREDDAAETSCDSHLGCVTLPVCDRDKGPGPDHHL
jgi:hypothetical protein